MKLFDDDFDYIELETSAYQSAQSNVVVRFLILISILCACALFIAVTVGFVFIYVNCTRPGRVHKKIPIEYLN